MLYFTMPKRKKKFYLQKQLDEILVLRAIYGKDFKVDEDGLNDLIHPKGFSVKLHPLVDMSGIEKPEIYVSVQMNVKYPKNYPAKLPMIEFSNLEGIGNEAMGKIKSIIYEMAEKKKGEVMIYELCIEVQEQLIPLNRPAEFHSFYDGMIHNNLLKKQKEQGEHRLMKKKLQEQEERENKEILEKLDKRRAEARQALRSKKHEQRLFADNTEQVAISKHLGDTSIAIVRKLNLGWVKNISPPKFVKLQEISCNNNLSIYSCMLKNELATVTEWRLDFEKCSIEKSCQISLELERVLCDFDSLKNVKHSNILQYLYAGCYFQGSCLLVGIWKKHDHVLPVSRYVRNNNPGRCPLSVIKLMAKDILQALRFLHNRNITHDAITLDCLWEGGHQFFLSDFSTAHQLNRIQWSLAENGPMKNVSNRVEDVEYAKSDDVSALGFCIVELAVGVEADHIYLRDRIASIIRPLKNLINLMVAKRRSERWTCELLLSHALLTSDVDIDEEKNDQTNSQFSHADLLQSIHDVSSIDCYEQSKRIESEFQVLKVLGRGGFGDVLKVKNKLDRCQYALKRVPLSTGDISQSRKILREVKLLSHLNHDNVVRYYNSWIETVHLKQNIPPNDCTKSYSTGSGEQQLSLELLNLDVKTQTSANSSSFIVFEDEHNDDNEIVLENNDSGEMSSIGDLSNEISMENDDDDDSLLIAFENGDEEQQQSIDENSELDSTVVKHPEMIQILYIQMEICEKSTLRLAIDNGELFVKPDRAWRFFREILEGLTYIHSKGCIHRDLKPSNIFISLNDQAKIGDFGLAISGQSERFGMDDSQSFTLNESDMKDTTISNVGTAMYMSPEMSDSHRCSAKVDIYSLGIILFEMLYPMKTSMQRADVLVELRKPEIIIPDDFLLMSKGDEVKKLLKLMLDHRSEQRPSSAALLNSDLLPISEMEPFEFHYNLSKVLANCCSSNMKQLFSMIFSKSPSAIEEYLYDDQLTCYFKGHFQDQLAMCRTKCETKLAALFHLFGGVHVNAPLLVPRTRILSESYPNRMEVMNTDGMVLNLPYDLRYNFARFAARQKIMRLKRYEIGTVFRQRENPMNPQELLECAFDILAPQPDFTHAIVELFSLISAVVDEFSFVKYSDLQIKINHLGLLKAFMENCSVTESSMQQKFLVTLSSLKSKFQRECAVCDLLKEWKITAPKLVDLVSKERCLSDALQWFAQDAQQYELYLSELKRIISMAETVCGQLAICVDFGYVVSPNIYTDVVFCVIECKKFSKLREDCVAIGGCYSNLMRNLLGPGFKNQPVPLTAVGLSFWFNRLFFTLAQDTAACEQNLDSSSRVLIISIGQDSKIEQKFRLMKMLRANKIPTDCWYESSESLDQAICWARRMYIGCVILLKAGDPDLRVKMIEKDRVVDRRVSMAELVPFLLERNSSAGDSSTAAHDNSPSTSGRGSSHQHQHQHHQSSLTNLNWHFVTAAPLTAKLRRGCEDRVSLMLFPFLNAVNFQHSVPVIVTDMPALIVRDFGSMNMETEATFNASIVQLIEIRQHYKKQILSVGSIIIDELFKSCHAFVLFASTVDNVYQILHR